MGGQVKNQHYVPSKNVYKTIFTRSEKICVWDLMNNTILTRQRPENYAAKGIFTIQIKSA